MQWLLRFAKIGGMNSSQSTSGQAVPSPDGRTRGQVVLEYLVVACVLISALAVLAFLLFALKQNGNRILDLVASEYP